MHRHHALTQEPMTEEALAQWIKNNSKDHYPHIIREFFNDEQKIEMQKNSADYTGQIIQLNDDMKLLVDAFKKGNVSEYEATIPVTIGLKKLTEARDKTVRHLKKGYSEHTVEVYEIPNEDGFMYHFTNEGELIEERTRGLTSRQMSEYFGSLFLESRRKAVNE